MHIVLYHDAVIPPLKYGGTERVIFWLAKALNQLGHRTTLIARAGSRIPGTELITSSDGDDWREFIPHDADILHLWATPGKLPRQPFVVTIEGNGRAGEVFHSNTIFISAKHAENHGAKHFVYNGIDPDDYVCENRRDDYAVFLAKASWSVKNLKGAIAVSRAAGLPLEVLGSRDWPWGMQRLMPRFRGVRYHGMVNDTYKRKILARARVLIFPVRWHEPFGIAVSEALASGCAVLATPYGSLPELVTAETGELSAQGSDLVRALRNRNFSAERCRARVLQGLTHLDMAKGYLKYYEHVLAHGRLGDHSQPESPRTKDAIAGLSSECLLPWTQPFRGEAWEKK